MKTIKMYEIRENGRSMSAKLRSFSAARKLAARLRRMGHAPYLAPMNIYARVPFVLGRTDIKL